MKITRKSSGIRCKFSALRPGEIFRYTTKIYIKVDKEDRAVDLRTGDFTAILQDPMVTYLQAKVVLL